MPSWCSALSRLVLAGAVAHASLTVTWNTHSPNSAAPAPVAASSGVRSAVVISVTGNRVILRLQGGTLARFTSTPEQARALQHLVGTAIQFRIQQAGAPPAAVIP